VALNHAVQGGLRLGPRQLAIAGLVTLAWLTHIVFCEWRQAGSVPAEGVLLEVGPLAISAANASVGFVAAYFCGLAFPLACAIAALALFLHKPRTAFPSLEQTLAELQNGESQARIGAAEFLARMGPHAAPAVPVLARALEDPSLEVRQMVARALARIGREAAPAVPALERALADTAAAVRELAARALGKIGSPAAPALPSLERLLKDPHELVRLYATEAIERIRGNRSSSDTDIFRA
jgi:HEAT repeat protein